MPSTALAHAVGERLHTRPSVAIIAGSGIVSAMHKVRTLHAHDMRTIPGMPVPRVEGHGASLVEAEMEGIPVLVFTGRCHLYEGRPISDVLAQIDVIASLGISSVVITNATGGLHPMLRVGDIALASDIIDLTFAPLSAPFQRPGGIDEQWRRATRTEALLRGSATAEGVLVQVTGPSYETRAEIGMLRRMGADLVGMSTVVEAKRAHTLGLRTLVCSMVTNVLSDTIHRTVTHDDVLDAAGLAMASMSTVLGAAVRTANGLSL